MKKFLKIFLLTCFLLGASNIYFAFATGERTATTTPRKLLYDAGTSLSFDGVDDVVTLNEETPVLSEYTFSVRAKPLNTGLVALIGADPAYDNYLGFNGLTGSLKMDFKDGTTKESINGLVTRNSWNHITFAYNGSRMNYYINGVLADFDDVSGKNNSFKILGAGYGTTFFNGLIDSPRIWNRALTPTEISNLYYNNIVPTSGLVGEWLFNEGSGTTALDTSGNGNNGTITGATYSTDVNSYLRSAITTPRATTSARTLIE